MKFNQRVSVGRHVIGEGCPVFLIAEAGLSHFGSEEKAFQLVDLAHAAGADAVKFQIFDIDEMYVSSCTQWRDRLAPRQLNFEVFRRVKKYCEKLGIIFFATAHDDYSLDFLNKMDVALYKVGSGEVRNWGYIKKVASIGKPVILSVGMYDFEEIQKVVEFFQEARNPNLIILHCVTDYPVNPKEVALHNIAELSERFGVLSGYSDHTEGFHIPLASVVAGARVIEKHITLEYDIPNAQDWKVSCGPDNLKHFVDQVRDVELSLSRRTDGPTAREIENSSWASKSVVLTSNLIAGEVILENHLGTKRPGSGICPSEINNVVGKRLIANANADTILTWEMLTS
ncbi:N-acetylneuraminate synthase family protein [Alphaproteobacteria bacterium]|nr:N-acetylneuraminate synthase family protein [Alphaproteobacteria bacterium]